MRTGVRGALAIGVLAASLTFAAAASAQTFTVTNLGNGTAKGDGTLRGEVLEANAVPGADTIVLAPGLTGTIEVTAGGIVISEALDIEGPGPAALTVEQTLASRRVFEVTALLGEAVRIAGLHLSGGTAPASGSLPNAGGDVGSSGSSLTIADDLVTDGEAGEGGGLYAEGPLTVLDSTISGNRATVHAGVHAERSLTMERSTVSGNIAEVSGGGIYLQQLEGSSLIEDSTIAGNEAEDEAGIELNLVGGTGATIENSTVTGNTATNGDGGGILAILGSSVELLVGNSTVVGNHARGGALDGDGGGIAAIGSTGRASMFNTIVSGNTGTGAAPELEGKFEVGFDLIGSVAGATVVDTGEGLALLGADPQLSPLADNGGPTETMALAPTSPAVNSGGGLATSDQRGLPRPVIYPGVPVRFKGSDIGAYELQLPAPPVAGTPPVAPPAPPVIRSTLGLGKVKLNKAKGTATVAVAVNGPGTVRLEGTKRVLKASRFAKAAGTVLLTVKARGAAAKRLKRDGEVKLVISISFDPTIGAPVSRSRKLKLVEPGS